ncbi:hypothetical protein [Scytonema sp. PRP1]|uniref:hypothetical protein n=1 Tax=Scytonema sp. PRP1 TaxID=3120513 RepID=UPI002FCF6531
MSPALLVGFPDSRRLAFAFWRAEGIPEGQRLYRIWMIYKLIKTHVAKQGCKLRYVLNFELSEGVGVR